MTTVTIKPTDAAIRNYQKSLADLTAQGVRNEGGLRTAFASLLRDTSRKRKWNLVEELPVSGGRLRPDGTLRDSWQLPHGYWEAKDAGDDLEVEIRNKRDVGYPFSNTIFENTQSAVLFQNERRILTADCNDRKGLAALLTRFYRHETPDFSSFEEAVERFSDEVPQLAQGIQDRINKARVDNPAFVDAFASFMTLCSEALNPNISREAVEEMLIQHLLTERLIRRVFDQENFVRRNVIAAEVEKVIDALTSRDFNRRDFLGSLDRFYRAIEGAADRLADFSDKQRFINTIYERFFQGFSVRVADTHGIVYTPQEVVEFMVAATDELLQREFGKKLGDEGVCVIDPCTGTGNFVVQLLRRVARENRPQLDAFYRERLFANEVMLMPYYIASLNIEHEYHERSGRYESFEGLCFVDTLDLAEGDMPEMFPEFSQRNSARVERQKAAKINVVIGNPPYNVGQINENDNNKNRKYEVVDRRIRETYAADSQATLKMQLYDAYVKFFRWASDRLEGRDGIVCFISNNSFVDGFALDGMRRELLKDFTQIWHLDLHGNVRRNPKLSGTTHNVFGIQVGVGITVASRNAAH
ncbi:MAG: N-6 DNA methylase, partial [Anaerolineae bacterium]|nr:N-6 DNA methylase [Anaerolineae bacterium]